MYASLTRGSSKATCRAPRSLGRHGQSPGLTRRGTSQVDPGRTARGNPRVRKPDVSGRSDASSIGREDVVEEGRRPLAVGGRRGAWRGLGGLTSAHATGTGHLGESLAALARFPATD